MQARTNLYLVSMETHALLALGAFIALTIHIASYAVSAMVTRRRKSVVNGIVAEKESAVEKTANEYSEPTRTCLQDGHGLVASTRTMPR